MAKMKIIFDGFSDLADAIDRAGKDLKSAVDEALNETQKVVKNNLMPAAAIYDRKGRKGYATGKMYKSIIKDANITWKMNVAEIGVGFTSKNGKNGMLGFMHSIFVMYGTPKMKKDVNVYNAIRGTRTRNEIAETQERIMLKHLEL